MERIVKDDLTQTESRKPNYKIEIIGQVQTDQSTWNKHATNPLEGRIPSSACFNIESGLLIMPQNVGLN